MKLKKMLCIALSLILMLSLASCGSSPKTTDSESTTSDESTGTSETTESKDNESNTESDSTNKTIIVGTTGANEPYSFINDSGDWTGVEAELWAEVEKRLGWKVEVKQVADLASLFGELETGRIDVSANCFAITEARLEKYIASAPFYADAQVIAVKPDSEYNTLDDLKGKTIGVTAGQAAQNTVEGLAADYDWEIVTYEDTNAGFQDCNLGRIDAYAHTVTSIEKAKNAQGLDLRMLDEKLFGNNVGWWFTDTDEGIALRDELNEVIKEMHDDGTISEITTKWFFDDLTKLISDEWLTATH